MASAPTACPNTSRRNRGIVPAPREAGPCSVNGTPQFRFVCAGIQIEERRGIKNGFLYCCSRAEGYEGRHHCRQNRSAYSCCNDLWDCRIHPIGVVPRLLLVHLRSGVRWRLCFSRSFYLFFFVSVEREKSRKNLLALLGFLPYFYSLYIMGVLGLYTIYEGIIGKFSFWSMIGGLFWVFLGFHLIYRFYLMTEIVRQHDEKAMLAHSTLRQSDMN